MPHLDDGHIAEWIDSAGRRDGETPERRDGGTTESAVAEHLRECAVCRERVEEARRIAQRARAILGAAAPAVTDTPPFDVVLARAGRVAPRRGVMTTWRWLAWAATVVIAGGLGWFARGERLPEEARPAPPITVGRLDSATPLATAPLGKTGGAAGGVAPATPIDTRASPAQSAVRQQNDLARADRQEEKRLPADRPAAEAKAAAQEADAVLRDSAARGAVAGIVAAPPAAAAPSVARNAAEPAAVDELAAGWHAVPREAAERVLGGPVATVPALPVTRYELLVPESVVRVLQELPSGAQLELLESTQPKSEPVAAYAGREREQGRVAARSLPVPQDTVTLDGVRVTLRAAVAPDSLKVLRGKIRR
jgi:hypothetical protein